MATVTGKPAQSTTNGKHKPATVKPKQPVKPARVVGKARVVPLKEQLSEKTAQAQEGWKRWRRSKNDNARLGRDIGGWLERANEICLRLGIPWGKYTKERGFSQSMEWRFRKVYRERAKLFDANDNPRPEVFIILHGQRVDGDDTNGETEGEGTGGKSNEAGSNGKNKGKKNGGKNSNGLTIIKVPIPKRRAQNWRKIVKKAREHFEVDKDSEAILLAMEEWHARIGTVETGKEASDA